MDNKRKHLELITSVINRLAGNSFLIKGWGITIIAALLALAAKDKDVVFVYVAYFPIIAFWALDAYFLRQERLFRKLYDHVRLLDETGIDFTMDTRPFQLQVESWVATCFSKTLFLFHGAILVTTAVVAVLLFKGR